MRPFLKWAGNKYQIIERIKKILPAGNRLIEPFLGSGAVFLNTHYSEYLLSDINADLINLYRILQKEGESFVHYCKQFFTAENNRPEKYYELRELFNNTKDIRLKSALFLYLNKHGYNGLCRYNSKGKYNVPFGRYKKPYFPQREMLYFHHKAQRAVFENKDFITIMKQAKKGDVVYCDPPYVPLSGTAKFTNYSSGGFGFKEQQQLADLAQELAQRGVIVVISNHDTQFTQRAYQSAKQRYFFPVQRFISCQGASRTRVNEVLALFAGS